MLNDVQCLCNRDLANFKIELKREESVVGVGTSLAAVNPHCLLLLQDRNTDTDNKIQTQTQIKIQISLPILSNWKRKLEEVSLS